MHVTAKDIARQAIIAALYAVITISLAPISYGMIQFRLAEMLVVLPFLNKKHIIGVTLGCLVANIPSLLGPVDIVVGTLATFIVCVIVSKLPAAKFIPLVAAAVNGVIIGLMLYLVLGYPLLPAMGAVAFGVFVVTAVGSAAITLARNQLAFLRE